MENKRETRSLLEQSVGAQAHRRGMSAARGAVLITLFCGLALQACLSSRPDARPPVPATPGSGALGADSAASAGGISREFGRILGDTLLRPALFGIRVFSLADSSVVYDLNAEKLFHPASNMKLFTTAAGLHFLGSTFRFRTLLLTDGMISNGTLQGNLSVKAFGDPLIRTGDLDSLARELRARGIRRITGRLIGDAAYFDTLSWGKGWMWDDEPDADEAFLSALTLNGNAVDVEIVPGRRTGAPPVVLLSPPTTYMEIQNLALTGFDTLIPPLTALRRHGENILRIDGRIDPGSGTRDARLSVCRPERYFLHVFRERLALAGITVAGASVLDSASGTILLGGVDHPIDSVLREINKTSDNVAAENMLKTIAAERSGSPGSASTGLQHVKGYLSGIGVDTAGVVLVDGSGVSWYTLVSPAALVDLLKAQYRNRETFRSFYESLPIAGTDGTLKHRMKGTRAADNVRAKTGSLSGESCISGYVTTVDGKMLAFSILCNHLPGDISLLRSTQDRMLSVLANYDTRKR